MFGENMFLPDKGMVGFKEGGIWGATAQGKFSKGTDKSRKGIAEKQ